MTTDSTSVCPGCGKDRAGVKPCGCEFASILGCSSEALNAAATERVDGRRWKILREFNDAAKNLRACHRDAFGPLFATGPANRNFREELASAFERVGDLAKFAAALRGHREFVERFDRNFNSRELLIGLAEFLGIDISAEVTHVQ
jgi:hypothetical protein